jgi:Ca-activated chloride channel homolog
MFPRNARRRNRAAAPALAGLTAVLLASALWAASPDAVPPPAADLPSFSGGEVSVGWVLVPVVVRTPGGYAENLDQEDFRLLVEGRPVEIASFERRADAPASVVVLQDLSGSMAGAELEASRRAVEYFLDRAKPGDEIALATFAGGRLDVEVPFTENIPALREALQVWEGYGTTALHDAVAWMPQISLEGHNSKRFALLITDGADNASVIPPGEARSIVREAQLPTYVLGLGSGSPYELTGDGKKVYRYADVLNLLATSTGGRYYSISGPGDLEKALEAIADDLRHQYVLGFSTREGANRFRKLQVEVRGGGRERRTVLFRRGYQGMPPAGSGG